MASQGQDTNGMTMTTAHAEAAQSNGFAMGGDQGQPRTIYVGNLDPSVTEDFISTLFSQIGQVTKCKIIWEGPTGEPYAFVEFGDHSTATQALMVMDKRVLLGREMKVNWATQPGNSASGQGEVYVDDDSGPKVDTSKHFHIFVGDLSPDVDSRMLREAFTPFGEVSEAKVIREFSPDAKLMPQPVAGKSKGYGFVAFPKKEEAERAIEQMNGAWLGRRAIRTNWATRRGANASQRTLNFDEVYNQTSQNNSSVYVGNLSVNVSEDDLRHMFSKFGNIQEIRNFKNQGYAFVRFDSKEAACHAICNNNNAELDSQVIRCSWGRANDGSGGQAAAGGAGAYGYGYGYGAQPGAAYGQAQAGGMANAAQAQQYQQYWNQYYQYYNNPAMMQQQQQQWKQ